MSEPIVFISRFRIKEGRVDDVRRHFEERAGALKGREAPDPRLPGYVDRDARAVACFLVHAFGDAEAMDLHFEGAEEQARAAYELLEPDGWEELTAAQASRHSSRCGGPLTPSGST